jgi:hypothetical protein
MPALATRRFAESFNRSYSLSRSASFETSAQRKHVAANCFTAASSVFGRAPDHNLGAFLAELLCCCQPDAAVAAVTTATFPVSRAMIYTPSWNNS